LCYHVLGVEALEGGDGILSLLTDEETALLKGTPSHLQGVGYIRQRLLWMLLEMLG
jgi:hypothetical protein